MTETSRRGRGPAARILAVVLPMIAAAAVLAVHLPRLAFDLPVYGGDEGTYLIRALLGHVLAADPSLAPRIPEIDNTVFLGILRGLSWLTPSVLEAARVLGMIAYFAGLVLTWRAVKAGLTPTDRWAFLLLALIFPYHRFIVTALPEGWYVGLLGLMILTTARLWRVRPLAHAVIVGAMAAVLVLIKPHGVAVVAALGALALADALLDRERDLRRLAGRLILFAATFLLVGNLIANLDGVPPGSPLFFFGNGYYAATLSEKVAMDTVLLGLKSLAATVSTVVLLCAVPILAGLADLGRRWRRERGDFQLGQAELAFLLTLLTLLATVAMIGIFAVKAIVLGPGEAGRLWGRYFEFFAPLLWLTAAPAIVRWDKIAVARAIAADTTAVGLAAVIACLMGGVMIYPWDATAMSAFYRPDMAKWPFVFTVPVFPLAVAATLITVRLMFTKIRTVRIWQGYFAALALLACTFDEAWVRAVQPARVVLGLEIGGARLLTRGAHGRTVTYFDDINDANAIFRRLEGGTKMRFILPGAPIDPKGLRAYQTVIVQGDHAMPASDWTVVQPGFQVKVYRRTP